MILAGIGVVLLTVIVITHLLPDAPAPGTNDYRTQGAATPVRQDAAPAAGAEVPETYFNKVERDAFVPCTAAIENMATYDIRWTSGFLSPRFSRWNKYQRDDGTLQLTGDAAEMQNGFGNWLRVTYRCVFDPKEQKVVNVTIDRGKLPTLH
jgi:hypothetical protein